MFLKIEIHNILEDINPFKKKSIYNKLYFQSDFIAMADIIYFEPDTFLVFSYVI